MPSNHGLDASTGVRSAIVRPRDAASLLILRGSGRETRILLGRRAPRHAFMPDVYVFPGGGVQRSDRTARPLQPLPQAECGQMRPDTSQVLAQALATAAARETHEETGLLFGRDGAHGFRPALDRFRYLGRAITPVFSPIRFHARFFIVDAEHAEGELGGSGELLDLRWVRIDEALAMPVVDVTEIMLRELARRIRGAEPRRPFVHYRGEEVLVRNE